MLEMIFEPLGFFIEKGGSVLYVLFAVFFIIWALATERIVFLMTELNPLLLSVGDEWEEREDKKSWYAHKIREGLISCVKARLDKNISLIKALVVICPLLGLLGTVTGMIEVFEVMSFFGNGSSRLMADGISKATIPTMVGMFAAISGILLHAFIQKKIDQVKFELENRLTFG